jgi:hypothetical protein
LSRREWACHSVTSAATINDDKISYSGYPFPPEMIDDTNPPLAPHQPCSIVDQIRFRYSLTGAKCAKTYASVLHAMLGSRRDESYPGIGQPGSICVRVLHAKSSAALDPLFVACNTADRKPSSCPNALARHHCTQ